MKELEKKEPIEIPPHDPSSIIRFGIIFLIIVFGILGGWMAYAPLAASSVASGKVVMGGVKRKVQHIDGGRVKKIYVQDGDYVKKGDILIKLDDAQIKEMLKNLKSEYQRALAKRARLQAELDNNESIEFPDGISNEYIENQQRIFKTRKKSLQDQDIISQKRVMQSKKQISALEALINSNTKRLKDASKLLAEQEVLFKQKLISKTKIEDLKKEINGLKGDIASKQADIARLKEKINEIQTQQFLSKKKFKEDVLNQLVKTQSDIDNLKAKIAMNEEKLKRTEIKAPIGGTIVDLKVHTVGDVIKPGADILEIVPDNYEPLIVAYVNLKDIDKVKIGQECKISFPSFDMRNMQPIKGKVVYISADTVENRKLKGSFYEAKIKLTKEGKKELEDNKLALVSGMPAVVMINIGNRTALEYFIKPFKDMFRKSFNEE